jgi:hypothetical protein
MNLKRGVLLSVAALMMGLVGVVACTQAHEDTAQGATVDEACTNAAQAPEATNDDASRAVFTGQPGGREGPEGPRPGWGPGGPEGPREDWGEEARGRGQRRGRPEGMRGRRGHGRGRRGEGRAREPRAAGQGELKRLEREVRPWVRAVWTELMALVEQARSRDGRG